MHADSAFVGASRIEGAEHLRVGFRHEPVKGVLHPYTQRVVLGCILEQDRNPIEHAHKVRRARGCEAQSLRSIRQLSHPSLGVDQPNPIGPLEATDRIALHMLAALPEDLGKARGLET